MPNRKPIERNVIEDAIRKTNSMSEAARLIGVNFSRFKSWSKRFDLYSPNQFLKGVPRKEDGVRKWRLQDILEGKHPEYPTLKLKVRLIKAGLKEEKCEVCNNTLWLGKTIPTELHHRDGNEHNHRWENLQILCRNCHSFTDTFCGKNVGKIGRSVNGKPPVSTEASKEVLV